MTGLSDVVAQQWGLGLPVGALLRNNLGQTIHIILLLLLRSIIGG